MNWIHIFQGFWLGWFLSSFIPLQEFLNEKVKPQIIKFCPAITKYIVMGLSCHKCMATWCTLAITQNFYDALCAGFMAYVFERWYHTQNKNN